jgi:hypothetical protein
MLTTTLDGLWALQALAGIEVLAPELGLRPHLPSVESRESALAHPVATDLHAAGIIDAGGVVDETIQEWLTVLSRRDVAVLLYVQTPAAADDPERILLARFAHWWVALERCGTQVRLSGAGTATSERSAGLLINAQIERLCGQMAPAPLRPVTIDIAEILSSVHDSASLRSFLISRRFDADQIAILTAAADPRRSGQASIVGIQSGVGGGPARSHVEPGTVTIIDTPQGRLVSEHVKRGGKPWMIVSPGSVGNLASAVQTMMRNLPAQEHWHSYRKAV